MGKSRIRALCQEVDICMEKMPKDKVSTKRWANSNGGKASVKTDKKKYAQTEKGEAKKTRGRQEVPQFEERQSCTCTGGCPS